MTRQGLAEFVNISEMFGIIMARRQANLHELQTVYSLEDALDMLEVIRVDAHNRRQMAEDLKKSQR